MQEKTLKLIKYTELKKKIGIAYILLFIFGIFGAHKFYVGENTWGTCELMLLFFSFIFFITVSPIGIFFFILLDIAVFCDIFLIPSAIKKENFKIMASLGIDPTEVR